MFKRFGWFYLLITAILTRLFTYRLKPGEFIYSGDAFFRINTFETYINGFFIRKFENLGVHNGWQFIIQFWDVVYYRIFYLFSNNFILGQKILLFIILFISFYLPYLGLKKIKKDLNLPVESLSLLAISAWYTINPYTVSLWHGKVFTLGAALTYSLAPLIIAQFHQVLFRSLKLRMLVIFALYMGIASFTFWLFAPLAFLLALYLALHLLFNHRSVTYFLQKLAILLLTYIPLIAFILFSILYEYFNSGGNNNSVFQPTFGNQQGGLYYQILMLYSWGIYTIWTPRAMYPFYKYYFTLPYIASTLSIYGLILTGLLNGLRKYIGNIIRAYKRRLHFPSFSLNLSHLALAFFTFLLLVSLFLAKAVQPPLGEVFLYLYNRVPFFNVFRTADIRFGFSVIVSLTMLLLLVSRHLHTIILTSVLILIIATQSRMFFTGQAIYGEEIKDQFYDHIISIPPEYYQVTNYLNADSEKFGYVLPLPAVDYGTYKIDNGYHLGQDLLPKLTKFPFLYLSPSNGIYTNSYKLLDQAIKNNDLETIIKFPIKYFILRKDIDCSTCSVLSEEILSKHFRLVIQNATFKVYKNDRTSPLINGGDIQFTVVNPTTYRMHISNLQGTQSLNYLSSFNKDWKLYASKGAGMNYLFKKPLAEGTHQEYQGFANHWTINSEDIKQRISPNAYSINNDGSINFDLMIFYAPQAWFYVTLIISLITGVTLLGFLLYSNKSFNTRTE